MRSKTLSCEKTIFLKEITRFWPLWGAYIAVLTLEVIGSVGLISDFSGRDPIYGVLNYITAAPEMGVVAAFIASILTAMAVYSYMYTPKSISFAESLPVTRTSNFLTRFFAGLFWLSAVNIIVYGVFAIIVAISGMGCAGAVMGVLTMNLLFILFFYGFASFCAVLTGSIVVLPLVFIVLNFTAVAVETLCRSLLQMIVYGLTGMGMSFSFLSPSVELMRKCGAHLATATASPVYLWNYSYDEIPADLKVVFDGFGTAAIYAGVGIVFVILALLIYKKRHMENAGDVVAVRAAKPIFRYCMTFGCALVIGLLLYTVIFGGGYGAAAAAEVALCMVIGGFIGYFASEMLMQKSFRVFKGKWVGFIIAAIIILLFVGVFEFDVFGIEKKVPDVSQVESVTVRYDGTRVSQPENIEAFTDLHRSIIANKDKYEAIDARHNGYSGIFVARSTAPAGEVTDGQFTQMVNLDYNLKNGKTLSRSYVIYFTEEEWKTPGTDAYMLEQALNSHEAIFSRKNNATGETYGNSLDDVRITASINWETPDQNNYNVSDDYTMEVYSRGNDYTLDSQQAQELYDRVLMDMEEGTIGRIWVCTGRECSEKLYDATINFDYFDKERGMYVSAYYVTPSKDSVHTVEYLESLDIQLYIDSEIYGENYSNRGEVPMAANVDYEDPYVEG